MIRRWSHLNALTDLSVPLLFKWNKKIKLRLFKINVKFKRFRKLKIKLTRLTRTSLCYLKPASKFVILIKSLKFWAIDYQITQNLIKFEYTYNIFLMSYFLYDGNRDSSFNEHIAYNVNFLLSNCTKKTNFAILPISTIYLNKEAPLLFIMYKNKNARFAWNYETFSDLDESLYVSFFVNNDFNFYNVTDFSILNETDSNLLWETWVLLHWPFFLAYYKFFLAYSAVLSLTN
jgi:hypothetical protein